MTIDEALTLDNDTLDREAAKVMGWHEENRGLGLTPLWWLDKDGDYEDDIDRWHPSTNASDDYAVLERVRLLAKEDPDLIRRFANTINEIWYKRLSPKRGDERMSGYPYAYIPSDYARAALVATNQSKEV